VIVFDEPTAALSVKETDVLFKLIRDLRDQGTSIIYISHYLPEVLALADRITVLRNGQKVATVAAGEVSENDLITLMIARNIGQQYPKRTFVIGAERLRVRGLAKRASRLAGVDFSISASEIVGFAGLVGSGRTELAKAIFEGGRGITGDVLLDGAPFRPATPRHAMQSGIVMIPENRRQEGLVSSFDVVENLSIPRLAQLSLLGVRSERRIEERGRRIVGDLAIKTPSVHEPVITLSGGNQQKVSLGKWFDAEARVWIFDEPTQGIDVETKSEIYAIMQRMAEGGAAIWFISSDLRELTAIADRIYVMRAFRIVAEYAKPYSTEKVLAAMLGNSQQKG
jgi:ABC-type sugar transport system ATPase subunit